MVARLSKRALFASLRYEPHAGQVLVHRSKAPRRVLACGSRWGKTTCGAMEAVAALLEPRSSSVGWVVAPTYETSELIFGLVMRTLREHFVHRIVEYVPREHRLVVVNLGGGRSEVRAKSAEDSNGLVGAALDWVVLDEAARVSEGIWECLSPRLIDREGWSLLLSTPRGCNWFHSAWLLGRNRRDPRCKSWSSPSWENPHVDAVLIQSERKSLDSEAFDQTYAARFVGAQIEPCIVCGGPRAMAPSCIVLARGEEPSRCLECNGYVDGKDGTTRVALVNGKPLTMLFELAARRPAAMSNIPG